MHFPIFLDLRHGDKTGDQEGRLRQEDYVVGSNGCKNHIIYISDLTNVLNNNFLEEEDNGLPASSDFKPALEEFSKQTHVFEAASPSKKF